jgi:hypothetical protein
MAPRNAAGQAAKAQRRKENIPWRLGGRQPKRDKNLFPNLYGKIPQIEKIKSAEFFLCRSA